MNLIHISEKYDLNDLEKQIVAYIEDHLNDLKSIGIRQMAKDNYTSTSTIYKFCHKLGFKSYSDMIYHLTTTKDVNDPFFEHYDKYKETFNKIINHNQLIIVFGLGFSAPIAEYLQQRLTLAGYRAMSVVHLEMLSEVFMDNTVLIIISFSGQTPRLNEIVQTALTNHIPVISFVGNPQSPIYKYSTLPILIGDYDSFFHELNRKQPFFGETILAFETLLFD